MTRQQGAQMVVSGWSHDGFDHEHDNVSRLATSSQAFRRPHSASMNYRGAYD